MSLVLITIGVFLGSAVVGAFLGWAVVKLVMLYFGVEEML